MKTLRLIKRDITNGLLKGGYKYLIVIVITAFMCRRQWHVFFEYFLENHMISNKGGFYDYLLGVNPGYKVFSVKETFAIPIYWLVFQLGVHYIISDYASDDFREYGKIIMPRTKSSGKWWISKCIWCFLSVLVYYILMLVTTLIMTKYLTGKVENGFSEMVQSSIAGSGMKYILLKDIPLITVFVPFVVTLALCFVQMLLSFFLTSEISYALICGIYVLSAFYHKWWMIGGFTMWIRSSYVISDGLEPKTGLMAGIFLIVACVVLGKVYFDDKDII